MRHSRRIWNSKKNRVSSIKKSGLFARYKQIEQVYLINKIYLHIRRITSRVAEWVLKWHEKNIFWELNV